MTITATIRPRRPVAPGASANDAGGYRVEIERAGVVGRPLFGDSVAEVLGYAYVRASCMTPRGDDVEFVVRWAPALYEDEFGHVYEAPDSDRRRYLALGDVEADVEGILRREALGTSDSEDLAWLAGAATDARVDRYVERRRRALVG